VQFSYEGLYFQGVGANLQEPFPFVAENYVPDAIVACPQLDDWENTSANMTIALIQWLKAAYAVDPDRVVLSGYSGGGETLSLVMEKNPGLFAGALHMSSQWDGDPSALVSARAPVRFVIGEHDDYYGPGPDRSAYRRIRRAYRDAGVSDSALSSLLVLDVKDDAYFTDRGYTGSQHAAGASAFAEDEDVMGWLFDKAS
jgi:predicted peptidase